MLFIKIIMLFIKIIMLFIKIITTTIITIIVVPKEPGVCIVTRIWVRRTRARIPVGAWGFSVFQIAQTCCGAHPVSYLMGTEVLSQG